MAKLTYKKVLTWRKKDVNIIKDQAKKVDEETDYEKTFKNFKKSVDIFRQAW